MDPLPDRQHVYLIVRDVHPGFARLRSVLRPLGAILDETVLRAVDVFYRKEGDTAVVGLHLDRQRVTRARYEFLVEQSARGGATIVEPETLPGRESAARFHDSYLARFDQRLEGLPTLDAGIRGLARVLGRTTTPPPGAVATFDLTVRFRRGERWQPGRVCCLSSEGAWIAAAGPPRAGDDTEIELAGPGLGGRGMILRATVVQPTSIESARVAGAGGFGARFVVGVDQREPLERIVGAIGPALFPQPPRRGDVRYPLSWPVTIARVGDATEWSAIALDVSPNGLFVTADAIDDQLDYQDDVLVTMRLPDGGEPLHVLAQVVRQVGRHHPLLAPGFGLRLIATESTDLKRYLTFVSRVGRRSERLVIVGAANQRAEELGHTLTAAGYSARRAVDPASLVSDLVDHRAPDLVVIDRTLEKSERLAKSLARTLATRLVPSVRVHGESSETVLDRVDAALI